MTEETEYYVVMGKFVEIDGSAYPSTCNHGHVIRVLQYG